MTVAVAPRIRLLLLGKKSRHNHHCQKKYVMWLLQRRSSKIGCWVQVLRSHHSIVLAHCQVQVIYILLQNVAVIHCLIIPAVLQPSKNHVQHTVKECHSIWLTMTVAPRIRLLLLWINPDRHFQKNYVIWLLQWRSTRRIQCWGQALRSPHSVVLFHCRVQVSSTSSCRASQFFMAW
jgi:hypothetical protein